MDKQTQEHLESFRNLARKIKSYHEAIGLLHWDLRTGAPKKGVPTRSETLGMLSTEAFKLQTSADMKTYLDALTTPAVLEQLEDIDRRLVEDCKKEYDRSQSVPPEKVQAYTVLTAKSETAWEDAKHNSDFAGFSPYLTDIVKLKQEFIDYWGVKDTRYDTFFDMSEPDRQLRKWTLCSPAFKARLVPLQEKINASENKPNTEFLNQLFDTKQQEKFSLFILEQMGYDFEAGRLDESVHPFATGLNPGDVRITTHYLQDDVASAVFSSLHEGGHALYEQNIDDSLAGTLLAEGTSMGIHESQSRLWENMIRQDCHSGHAITKICKSVSATERG